MDCFHRCQHLIRISALATRPLTGCSQLDCISWSAGGVISLDRCMSCYVYLANSGYEKHVFLLSCVLLVRVHSSARKPVLWFKWLFVLVYRSLFAFNSCYCFCFLGWITDLSKACFYLRVPLCAVVVQKLPIWVLLLHRLLSCNDFTCGEHRLSNLVCVCVCVCVSVLNSVCACF